MTKLSANANLDEIRIAFDVLDFSASEEANFERMVSENGYERKTTFYLDFAIADYFLYCEPNAVIETYNRSIESWKNDIEYMTELALVLNYRCWRWHNIDNELSEVYSKLYYEVDDFIYKHFADDKEALSYYYRVTD